MASFATSDLDLLDAGEVGRMLGVPKSWVYAETRAGRLPHVVVGRYRRYRRDAIAQWIVDHERGPAHRSGRFDRVASSISED
jgi:excisionase family DNA binding protein